MNDTAPASQPTQKKPKDLPSRFFKVIPSLFYNPPPKPKSRRDLWRAEVKERKERK